MRHPAGNTWLLALFTHIKLRESNLGRRRKNLGKILCDECHELMNSEGDENLFPLTCIIHSSRVGALNFVLVESAYLGFTNSGMSPPVSFNTVW